jgi:GGDEF domain-containing protein
VSSAPRSSDYHDALTLLPNRQLFDDRLKQALHFAELGAARGHARQLGRRHYRIYAL